jgi:hypothetical protein
MGKKGNELAVGFGRQRIDLGISRPRRKSFLITAWEEPSLDLTGPEFWRGSVKDLSDGETCSFGDAMELSQFILSQMHQTKSPKR